MANIVITTVSGKNYYKATFNDVSTYSSYEYKHFWGEDIGNVAIDDADGAVVVELKDESRVWKLSYNGIAKTLTVDSVLTVTPTDNDHLATLIANLRG